MITSRLLPPEDPVEAVFKPPESLPHSYMPAPPPKGASALSAPVSLRVPKALYGVGNNFGTKGPKTEELADEAAASRNTLEGIDPFQVLEHHLGFTGYKRYVATRREILVYAGETTCGDL